MNRQPKLYTLKEAADMIRVTPATLRRWGREGKCPILTPGRKMLVPAEWVERQMRTKTEECEIQRS